MMSIQKIKKEGNELEITIRVKLDDRSMLKSEEAIERALNEAGIAAGEVALKSFDTDGQPIEVEGNVLTSKGLQKKKYQGQYGVLEIERHVYQSR